VLERRSNFFGLQSKEKSCKAREEKARNEREEAA